MSSHTADTIVESLRTFSHTIHVLVSDTLPEVGQFLLIAGIGCVSVWILAAVFVRLLRQGGISLHTSITVSQLVSIIFYGISGVAALSAIGIERNAILFTSGGVAAFVSFLLSDLLSAWGSKFVLWSTDMYEGHSRIVVNGKSYRILHIGRALTELKPDVPPAAPQNMKGGVEYTELHPNSTLAAGVIGVWWNRPRSMPSNFEASGAHKAV
jgi:small-conductance mechanosensitive channel